MLFCGIQGPQVVDVNNSVKILVGTGCAVPPVFPPVSPPPPSVVAVTLSPPPLQAKRAKAIIPKNIFLVFITNLLRVTPYFPEFSSN